MKILHTSDWHLGKRLFMHGRLPEQREVILEIAGIADGRGADVIIIAGDVFDTALPSAEAQSLLCEALVLLTKGGARPVIVVSGNHDDPDRLLAVEPFSAAHGVIMAAKTRFIAPKAKWLIEAGQYYAEIEIKGERAVFALLPFPSDSRMARETGEAVSPDEPYGERVARWFGAGAERFRADTINVAVSHLFVTGALKAAESGEELELGTARQVDKAQLPKAHYTALGHIHKYQRLSKTEHIYYSGSPLAYAFDDKAEKCVILADITAPDGVKSAEKIPLKKGKKPVVLSAASPEEAEELLKSRPDNLVMLKMPAFTGGAAVKKLFAAYPQLLHVAVETTESAGPELQDAAEMSRTEAFAQFYKARYGVDAPPEAVALFAELLTELPAESEFSYIPEDGGEEKET